MFFSIFYHLASSSFVHHRRSALGTLLFHTRLPYHAAGANLCPTMLPPS
jgi:hypothetical protein